MSAIVWRCFSALSGLRLLSRLPYRARSLTICALWLAVWGDASAQEFSESNLPIIVIETQGREIVDEPKIDSFMGVIDNGAGQKNRLGDAFNGYDGMVGIEIRGASSQGFPKKSYALETRDAEGENLDVALLGMPEENDWVLYAPYSDKALLRNALAYWMARETGHYASRTRFCELFIDGDYRGVYVLAEKVKRDPGRVDIAKLDGDDLSDEELSGGYIIRIDRETAGGWYSSRALESGWLFYQYYYPAAEDIRPEQEAYIRAFFDELEQALLDGGAAYADYIDVDSFVDYLLLCEAAKNVDAYRLSTFMYKDRDRDGARGKLSMGPVWDFNLAFGNVDYEVHPSVPLMEPVRGLQINHRLTQNAVPFWFWWQVLLQERSFAEAVETRWHELRAGPWSTERLVAQVGAFAGELEGAQQRNFQRWLIMGQDVWPNYFVGQSYGEEVAYMQDWLRERLAWMDENLALELRRVERIDMADLSTDIALESAAPVLSLRQNAPNPFNSSTLIRFELATDGPIELSVYNLAGQQVATLERGFVGAGRHEVSWEGRDENGHSLASGIYIYRLETVAGERVQKMVLLQ